MAPKHKNPTRKERTAVAPYNFVSITDPALTYVDNEESQRYVNQSLYSENRLSGWIDVILETKSPVFIRSSLETKEYEQMEQQEQYPNDKTPHLKKLRNRPEFFYTKDKSIPVIPGSSLRGMLRTLAQIIGYGKLAPVSQTPLVYRALADMSSLGESYTQNLMLESQKNHFTPRFDCGYIEEQNGRWCIRPAKNIKGTTYSRISSRNIPNNLEKKEGLTNAYRIYIEPGPYEFQHVRGGFLRICYSKVQRVLNRPAPGLIEATLARSGKMFKKNSEAVVFPPDNKAELIVIPDGSNKDDPRDLITAYRDQVSPEQRSILGSPDGALQDGQPIFYLMEDEKLVFFGHTQMFRMVYANSPQEMLHSRHKPRHKSSNKHESERVDFAEAMFGYSSGDDSGQAGRVFITDANLLAAQEDIWLVGESGLIPDILSSPKPTTFQHYLTQSRPDSSKGKALNTYNDSHHITTLRGFKMYWHKGDKSARQLADKNRVDEQKDTQHTKMRPVRSGVQFQFRVYYENMLLDELGLLWWSLSLPAKGEHYHKIGMGKPLGMGAVKLSPRLIIVSPVERYGLLFNDKSDWNKAIVSEEKTNELLKRAIDRFERGVLNFLKQPKDMSFEKLERIQQFLQMLAWPGPLPPEEKSRYMEIERYDPSARRKKRNEYRERPVLPDPLHVMNK